MVQFCNPEKEGQQGQQEIEKVPSGFGAPRMASVASHGVLVATQSGKEGNVGSVDPG